LSVGLSQNGFFYHNVSVVVFQNMYPYVSNLDDERVKDLNQTIEAVARAKALGDRLGVRVEHLPMAFDVDQRTNGTNGHSHPVFHCNNVWEQIHVTVKGEVKFCCWWKDGAIGDLTKDDLGLLWNSPEWRSLRRDISLGKKPTSCQGCHNLVRHDTDALWKAAKAEMRDLVGR